MLKKIILYILILILSVAALFAAGKYVLPALRANSDNTAVTTGTNPTKGSAGQTSESSQPTQPGNSSETTTPDTTQGPAVDANMFPLKVSENGRYLTDQHGDPFFPIVDTGWMVFSYINEEDAKFYLEQRRQNGVNTILCYAAPFMLGTPNAEGEVAFFNDNLSKPNDKYWDYVEHLIDVMADMGMQVIMCPCEMYQYREKYSVKDATALGNYLGQRFKDVKNLMWFTGGDIDPTPDQVAFSDALALGIREYDTNHIISFHPAGGSSSSEFFNDFDWLDYNMVQVFSPDSPKAYTMLIDDYVNKPTRPTILIEPCYEDNGDNTPYQVRRAISWGVTSGSFGMTYGSKNVYKYILPDWKNMLDRPAFNHFSNIAEMVSSRKWFLLEPDTSGKLIKSGSFNYGSVDYASTSIASDGSFAISYFPDARAITLDMSVFNGEKTVKWFDPTDNTFVNVGTYPSSGTIKLQARPKNSAGESDWFLVIE